MRYFDAHCHIQFDVFDTDRDAIIEKMRVEGIGGIVVGCDLASSQKAVELAQMHDHLYASIGLHPNREKEEWFTPEPYRELLKSSKVVAIGECGLDYFRPEVLDEETKRTQKAILTDQIRLAVEFDKPLILHSRPAKGTQDAYRDLIALLTDAKKTAPNLRGDIHFFVGGIEEMKDLTALGFTVSYTAVVTFARDYDDVIRQVPLESLITETDSPYVSPKVRRGQRNDPSSIPEIVTALAEIRGEEREKIREAVYQNATRMFGLRGS